MKELATLLGTTEEKLKNLAEEMEEFTGKKDIPQKLSKELVKERGEALSQLGLSESSGREEVLAALTERAKKTEEELLELLQHPDCSTHEGCRIPIKTVFDLAKPPKGFFLKEDKARELFSAHPPKGIMTEFGYDPARGGLEKMLAKEDIYHLFASLRFLEEQRWLNEEFFASYSSLTPDDFEKREIKMEVLPQERFGSVGAEFMRKKFHNVSHLKEMGLIFVLPVEQEKGVFLRMFSLLLHYLHEVPFYAKYFEQCVKEPETFTKNLTAALRGDVRKTVPPVENLSVWLIIQRYLAKEDPDDPRLSLPHISPEAMFWCKATDDLGRLEGSATGGPKLGLSFWAGKAHVAGVFGGKVTSFNFEDNVFSAARNYEAEQYTYHMHEALWNRLFVEYLDEKTLGTLMAEDFGQGFVGFRIRSSSSE